MGVTIIAGHGTHLLIGEDGRYAVVERRNGKLYNCHAGKRDGIPLDNLPSIGTILDKQDWTDRATAQAAFDDIVARGTHLSQTL